MAHLVPNMFSTYSLNEDEAIQSAVLTIDQEQNIQNQIALMAEKKLLLTPLTADFTAYIQEEAYYRGQIDALKYLLESSILAVQFINTDLNPTQD